MPTSHLASCSDRVEIRGSYPSIRAGGIASRIEAGKRRALQLLDGIERPSAPRRP
jgi:hypothetical protein